MSCERFTRAITDHACGADLDARTAAHLGTCEGCRRELKQTRQELEAADAVLSAALALTASPGFAAGVSARVRQAEPAISSWTARHWLGLAAAGIILVVALATGSREAFLPGPRDRAQPEAAAQAPVTPGVPAVAQRDQTLEPPGIEPRTPPSSRPRHEKAHRTVQRPTTAASKTREPDVIVPPDQQRAIARLRELLQSGALDQKDLPAVPAESSALAALVVQPLAVPQIIIPDVNRRPDTPPPGAAARDRP